MKLGPSPDVPIDAHSVVVLSERRTSRAAAHLRLEALFRDHENALLRFLAIRLGSVADARDCLQTVFARLLERCTALADDNLVSLLYVCARNAATDELRRRQHTRRHAGPDARETEIQDEAPSPDRQVQGVEELKLLMSLVDELPPKCRRAFVSYKLDGLEYRDIAVQMNITESMVRKYVIKAVAYCAARFEELHGWE
jgi:RNA polymerase sigma factor (sigma-70 family)